jgi:hypothetical protein
MIVFYTFDLPMNVDKKTQDETLLMLKISIHTVYRELHYEKIKVLIYSNNPEVLKDKLADRFPDLTYIKIDKKFSKLVENAVLVKLRFDGIYKDSNEIYRVINNNYGTAHYRTSILGKLLNEQNEDVLYLDYDTGIARRYGKQALDLISKSEIILEPKTADSIYDDIRIIYPEFKKTALPKYINPYACRWNCGVMYIKNTDENRNLTKAIFKYYRWLTKDLGFTQSADEWSIGLALFKYQMIPTLTFENTSFYSNKTLMLLHDNLPQASPFVHYMDQKNVEYERNNFKKMLNSWDNYFNANCEEPDFDLPDYTKKNSNDFIWGRFETL